MWAMKNAYKQELHQKVSGGDQQDMEEEEEESQIVLILRGKDKSRGGLKVPQGEPVRKVIQAKIARKYNDKKVAGVRFPMSKYGLVGLPEGIIKNHNRISKGVSERVQQWIAWLAKVAKANPEGYIPAPKFQRNKNPSQYHPKRPGCTSCREIGGRVHS